MVSGSLALLYFLLGFHGGRQDSGPDRGQSPVEWGDFPYVCPSICLAPLGHPPRPEAQPVRPEASFSLQITYLTPCAIARYEFGWNQAGHQGSISTGENWIKDL